MIYTVTLNPAIDYVVQMDMPLAIGRVNRNQKEAVHYGGKGINVSGVLKQLQQDSVALGFVAGFTGAGLEEGLKEAGLHTDFVHVDKGFTRINVKIKAGQETEINGMGPVIEQCHMDKLFAQLDRLVAGDYLILSGSVPACLQTDTYARIMQRLEGRDIRVVVDATGEFLLKALPFKPFLIKPNNHELSSIFNTKLDTDAQFVAYGRKLQQMGARNVLISLAGDGAILLDEFGAQHRIQCPAGNVVNSVAAGDSMVAGFVAGYIQSGDYDYALKLGTAAGSATAFSLGLAERDHIMKLFDKL